MNSPEKLYEVAVLGAGRMGSAIIKGLINNGVYASTEIIATHHDVNKATLLQTTLSVKVITSNLNAVQLSKFLIVCVKPQDVRSLLEEVGRVVDQNMTVISVAAAISAKMLRSLLGSCGDIYIVHPSSLIITGSPGISYIVCEDNCNNSKLECVKRILEALGGFLVVPEHMLNIYAVFAGCSPAFFAQFANQWKNQAEAHGIESAHASEIIANIFIGIAHGMKHNNMSLDEIIYQIATPKGITATGLEVLNSETIESLYSEVVSRCLKKFEEITI